MQPRLDEDIKAALKRGDKAMAEALRFLKSVVINAQISAGNKLNDDEIVKVIKKEIRLRIEARDMYAANGRSELAAKEEYERELYGAYVPDDLNPDKILAIINDIAKSLGPECTFSQLMPEVMKVVAGKADGKTVADIVRNYLEENKK